ncbi:HNH endonuclease [Streptomyces canus]|uniref:HNH endonuclease n=1 Tax=Streptomyces canus TaxID=58343 RepID=UPI0034048EB1
MALRRYIVVNGYETRCSRAHIEKWLHRPFEIIRYSHTTHHSESDGMPGRARTLLLLDLLPYWVEVPEITQLRLFATPEPNELAMLRCADGVEQCFDCARGSEQAKYLRNRAALLADGPACVYCGAPATTADHVIPQARGGTHDLDNLVAACSTCNSAKNNRTPDEWRTGITTHAVSRRARAAQLDSTGEAETPTA